MKNKFLANSNSLSTLTDHKIDTVNMKYLKMKVESKVNKKLEIEIKSIEVERNPVKEKKYENYDFPVFIKLNKI